MDGNILYAIMVAGCRNKLVPRALWEFMPSSKCASLTTSSFKPHSKNYSHRGRAMKKNTRKATAMKMTQLYTLALAAQGLDVMIKKDIQS